ncbi:hypothetical protein GN244_ATG18210 [Phytophthora infestans]|uniref:Uncharacterized protein n=1 Tax=Phytophthora infestans TaxID=4787 RepID=A0A833RPU9_PHYIN|nr:hypothetical protein GN244_ATG18210 [Phytophthora infestans]
MLFDDAVCIHWLSSPKPPKPPAPEEAVEPCGSPPGATVPAVCVASFSPPKSIADAAAKKATTTTAEAWKNRVSGIVSKKR